MAKNVKILTKEIARLNWPRWLS